MFISIEQPKYFLISIFIGLIIGFYYEVYYFLGLFSKNKVYKEILKILWLSSSSIIFIYLSKLFEFSNFRLYMFVGVAVSLLLYKLSFHKLIAIFLNRVYNIIKKIFFRIKNRLIYESRKEKARVHRSSFGACNVYNNTCCNTFVSVSRHNISKKQNRKVRCGNSRVTNSNRKNSR